MSAMFEATATAFRLYDDDAGEAASAPLENQDVAHTFTITANQAFQLRFLLEETGGADGKVQDDYALEYSKNSGAYVPLTTTDVGDGIRAVAAGLTNDAATTDRGTNGITNPGSGSFDAGEQSSDGIVDNMQLTLGNYTEHAFGIEIVDANVADTDFFDIRFSGSIVNLGTDVRVTVSKVSGPSPLDALPGSFSITGIDADLEFHDLFSSEAGTFLISGIDANLEHGYEVIAEIGTFSISGIDANLEYGYEVIAEIGTFSINGIAANLEYGYEVIAEIGTFSINGIAALFPRDYVFIASAGVFDVIGIDANLEFHDQFSSEAGIFLISGIDANLEHGYEVIADIGAFDITGIAATLTVTAITRTYLHPFGGVITLSGDKQYLHTLGGILYGNPPVSINITLNAEIGTFLISGVAANLEYGYAVIADIGVFNITGIDANLEYGYEVIAEIGTFSINGIAALFPRDYVFITSAGSFSISGIAAKLYQFGDFIYNNTAYGAFSGSISTNLAALPTAGNLLIIGSSNADGTFTITSPPSGFTLIESSINEGGDSSWVWYWKISDGTEQQSPFHSWSSSAALSTSYTEYAWGKGTPNVTSNENTTNIATVVNSQVSGSLTPASASNIMLVIHGSDSSELNDGGQAVNGSWIEDTTYVDTFVPSVKLSRLVNAATSSQTATHTDTDTGSAMYGSIVSFDVSTGPAPLDAQAGAFNIIGIDANLEKHYSLIAGPVTQSALRISGEVDEIIDSCSNAFNEFTFIVPSDCELFVLSFGGAYDYDSGATSPFEAPSTVVWDQGGTAQGMTLAASGYNTLSGDLSAQGAHLYYLINPTIGTHTLRITWLAAPDRPYEAFGLTTHYLKNIDLANPLIGAVGTIITAASNVFNTEVEAIPGKHLAVNHLYHNLANATLTDGTILDLNFAHIGVSNCIVFTDYHSSAYDDTEVNGIYKIRWTLAVVGVEASVMGLFSGPTENVFGINRIDANLEYGYAVIADIGAFNITGIDANLEYGYEVIADIGAFDITGIDATLTKSGEDPVLDAVAGVFNITGIAANLEFHDQFSSEAGVFTISGIAANLEIGYEVIADIGAFNVTGIAATLTKNITIDAVVGTFNVTGIAANLEIGYSIDAVIGAFDITGIAATLEFHDQFSSEAGAFNITGIAANLEQGYAVIAEIGSYSINGITALFPRDYSIEANIGSYSIIGINAELTIGEADPIIEADLGVYSINGISANLVKNIPIIVDTGSYSINGINAEINQHTRVLDPGTFLITGVSLLPEIKVDTGSYIITGFDADLQDNSNPKLAALSTTYIISGKDATLQDSTRQVLVAETGNYNVIGSDAILYEGDYLIVETGIFAVTGVDANLQDSSRPVLEVELGSYSITSPDGNLLYYRILDANKGIFNILAPDTITDRTVFTGDVKVNIDVTDTVIMQELISNAKAKVNVNINLNGEVIVQ